MSKILIYIFVVTSLLVSRYHVKSAKILAIFPYPTAAQYFTIKPFMNSLQKRGHEITLISHKFPNGAKPNIQLDFQDFDDLIASEIEHKNRRSLVNYHVNITRLVLENQQVTELLNDENIKFDMVIVDPLMPAAFFAIAEHFKAHLVGISVDTTEKHIDDLVGNESPISFLPLPSTGYLSPMDFFERVQNVYQAFQEWFLVNICECSDQQMIFKQHFPHLNKTFGEIKRNFALVLLNYHFSIGVARPYVPNMIEVGGMFMSDHDAQLPADILAFIEGSPRGVIYFSMGANIKLKALHKEKMEALLAFVQMIDYRVIWKLDNWGKYTYLTKNVMAREWFPQRAILAHPKVSLFITQAGHLSVMEAIIYGKPIVGIPIFTSHFNNMRRVEHFDIGIGVNYTDLNSTNLASAVHAVLNEPRYSRNVGKLRQRFLDRLTKPLDLATFWTEYILRHDGALFMRVPGRDMYWFAYANLDVLLFIAVFMALSVLTQNWCLRHFQAGAKTFYADVKNWLERVPYDEEEEEPEIRAFLYLENPDQDPAHNPVPPKRLAPAGLRQRRNR